MLTVKKAICWEPWRCEGIGGSSNRAQEDIGLLDKIVNVGFFQLWPCFFPDCLLYSDEPVVPSELKRTLGFLTKKPCILLEDRMRPQPFVSLGAASNFCLKQTSTQCQNRSLDPINYRIYQIACKCFHFVVMVNYILFAHAALVELLVRSLWSCTVHSHALNSLLLDWAMRGFFVSL